MALSVPTWNSNLTVSPGDTSKPNTPAMEASKIEIDNLILTIPRGMMVLRVSGP